MRISALLLVVALSGARLGAQDLQPSSDEVVQPSSSEFAAPTANTIQSDASAVQTDVTNATGDLPVSLDRIREALSRPSDLSGLHKLDIRPDFSVQVQEQAHIQAILSTLDFKSGPRPPGGLYGYEQQQRLWSKVDRPLAQPFAAFNSGELITLAIEGLMQKYLVGEIVNGISNAQRESAERAAREEVSRAVTDYCANQPDAGRSLNVCSVDPLGR
jgi:hypothetical protein